MVEQATLLRAVADYARTIGGPYDVTDVLDRLTDQVVEVLDVHGAGVSLAGEDGRLRFATASDDDVAAVEEHQIAVEQGPCHDAYRTARRVVAADLDGDRHWPDYAPTVRDRGYRAVAGIPMASVGHRIGALDLYRRVAGDWPSNELEVAQVLADMATGYIINARVLAEQQRVTAQLEHALDSRVVIEQAKGLLAERHGLDPQVAFERLRDHARDHNRQLSEVARALVEERLRL